MTPRRILITGATSGIGREVASQLVRQGAHLILTSRDAAKGQMVAEELAREGGGARPDVIACQLSDQHSIRRCAAEVRAKYDRLDVLINNAGPQVATRQLTVDGWEEVFATNMLAYFLLTQEMLPLLKASAPARIVNVASTYAGELDLEDLNFTRRKYDNVKSYKQSKQANRMWTWALARRLAGTGVTANAMTPGFIRTELYRDMKGPMKLFVSIMPSLVGRKVSVGADTVTWLATSRDVEGVSGKFWDLRKELRCQFRNEADEERLWKICEGAVASSAVAAA
jgi:NAD(P)-dependent dehydrogenase (short-subunit alcohol dehydrogenase family)